MILRHHNCGRLPGLLVWLLFSTMILTVPTSAFAQQCDVPENGYGQWASGVTVHYSINIGDGTVATLIQSAIDRWNNANQFNGSGVRLESCGSALQCVSSDA